MTSALCVGPGSSCVDEQDNVCYPQIWTNLQGRKYPFVLKLQVHCVLGFYETSIDLHSKQAGPHA